MPETQRSIAADLLSLRGRRVAKNTWEELDEWNLISGHGHFTSASLFLRQAHENGMVSSNKIAALGRWFRYYYTGRNFHNQREIKPKDVDIANNVIDQTLRSYVENITIGLPNRGEFLERYEPIMQYNFGEKDNFLLHDAKNLFTSTISSAQFIDPDLAQQNDIFTGTKIRGASLTQRFEALAFLMKTARQFLRDKGTLPFQRELMKKSPALVHVVPLVRASALFLSEPNMENYRHLSHQNIDLRTLAHAIGVRAIINKNIRLSNGVAVMALNLIHNAHIYSASIPGSFVDIHVEGDTITIQNLSYTPTSDNIDTQLTPTTQGRVRYGHRITSIYGALTDRTVVGSSEEVEVDGERLYKVTYTLSSKKKPA